MQKIKSIVFNFTDYTVTYTPTKKVFRTQHWRVEVRVGLTLQKVWEVTHFPNKTNALKLIKNNK